VESMTFVVAPGVRPQEGCRAALEAAAAELPAAVLLAAHVPGDEAWPRILDKDDAIEACRHGLVALRAVQPGAMLVRGAAPASFAEAAALLAEGRGYLVPEALATRDGAAARTARPGLPARLRLLGAPHFTREERLWQLFRLASGLTASRRAAPGRRRRPRARGRPSA
jgi:hypothetical protein